MSVEGTSCPVNERGDCPDVVPVWKKLQRSTPTEVLKVERNRLGLPAVATAIQHGAQNPPSTRPLSVEASRHSTKYRHRQGLRKECLLGAVRRCGRRRRYSFPVGSASRWDTGGNLGDRADGGSVVDDEDVRLFGYCSETSDRAKHFARRSCVRTTAVIEG